MSRVYWDSMLFIYWLEENPAYVKRIRQIRERMEERHDQLIASAFTVGEVLAGPYGKAPHRASELKDQLLDNISEVVPFTVETVDHYAQIRGTHRVSAPDALNLACAASADTDLFLTNDRRLVGKVIPGIQFIVGIDADIL